MANGSFSTRTVSRINHHDQLRDQLRDVVDNDRQAVDANTGHLDLNFMRCVKCNLSQAGAKYLVRRVRPQNLRAK